MPCVQCNEFRRSVMYRNGDLRLVCTVFVGLSSVFSQANLREP